MGDVLRTAVVTGAWILIQGLVGLLVLGRKGRPYNAFIVVIHIIVFVFIALGWFYTVQGLFAWPGNHIGTWIAQVVTGLAVVSQLAVGSIMTAGRKIPAPRGFVLVHTIGAAAALAGSLAVIACILSGV